ncbi:MAG TPA: carboxypeptidase regulatory-like domain-containing protein [Acidobacteriota bacterium]|nr:carboxypeptidase regulatory-like domain-containing protein [Acidobacteriota bacterium]
MSNQSKRFALIFSLLVVVVMPAALAQSGEIQGTVVDSQGAVIPGTKVMAIDENKRLLVREVLSGDDGIFQLPSLQPGRYTVRVELTGFKILERKGLVLDPNQKMNLGNLQLQLGEVSETVKVVETQVPLVETATAQKSFVVTSSQITELSLNGRDFASLIKTLPGVSTNAQRDFQLSFNSTDGFNVNGTRGSMNNVYMDGAINTDVGANDGQYTQISLEAVGEFKLQHSTFNAEYGRNPGILIAANTRSGGSDFHGTVYEFFRNEALDARRPFDQTRLRLRLNQFGGNIGGPIFLRNVSSRDNKRLFFFFNYEGTRGIEPNGGSFVDIPHPDLLRGDFTRMLRSGNIAGTNFQVGTVFQPGTITRDANGNITGGVPFPNNIVPQAQWNRNALAFLKILNAIDRSKGTQPPGVNPELLRVPIGDSHTLDKDQKTLRVDWHQSPNTSFFFRWVDDSQNESRGLGIFGSTPYPVYPMFRQKPGASWSWNLVNIISPSLNNEFIFAYNHLTQLVDVKEGTDPATYDLDKLGFQYKQIFPNANVRNKFPRFNCALGSCDFGGFASDWRSEGKTFAWTDNVIKTAGAHAFKTGLFFNMNDNGQQPAWTDAGTFQFGSNRDNPNDSNNGLANLLLGNYTSYAQSNGVFYGAFRFFGTEFYGQDSWRVNRKLMLEYGARYVYLGPTYTRGKFLMNYFDPDRYDPNKAVKIETARGFTQGSIVPGSGDPFNGMVEEGHGLPLGGIQHRKNQVSPRFGFAYAPFANNKTVIRGGFGTFFERIRQNTNNFDGLGNPPLAYTPSLFAGNLDTLSPALVSSGVRFPVSLRAIDKTGKVPTLYSWTLGIQHELPGQIALDVAYAGNVVRHLQYWRNVNQLPLGATIGAGNILAQNNNVTNAARPYKGYTDVLLTEFAGNSSYNGLQARVSRRFSQAFTFNANYTWSKSLSEVDTDDTTIGYFLDRHREWGPARFDRAHILNMDYVYNLPQAGTRWFNNGLGRTLLDGWELTGITRFQTGLPLTVTSPGNPGTLVGGGVRADYLGGPLYPEHKTRERYFNPLAFGRPRDGSLGNTGKGILRGPGIHNWDVSLFKNTRINERVRTQFRFETFNVFNHPQWYGINLGLSGAVQPGQPVTEATVGTMGQANSAARDPRNIQFAMKVFF